MSAMDFPPEPESDFNDEEVDFEVVEDRGIQATLECPACGFIFEVDAHTNLNLEWCKPKKAMIAICPICKRKQR